MRRHPQTAASGRRILGGLAVTLLTLAATGRAVRAVDDRPADEYARIEIRGVLRKPGPDTGVGGFFVVIGNDKEARRYQLVLTDDADTQRKASLLVGETVVVTGDFRIREEVDFATSRAGRRTVFGEIKVTSLEKAKPDKK